MNDLFKSLIDGLPGRLRDLLAMQPVHFDSLPKEVPLRGVYLFSEGCSHLYTGRSNRLRKRLRNHCRKSAGHNMATFAFRMARSAMGLVKATYKRESSRSALLLQPKFASAFMASKARVRKMDVRYVREDDPLKQALLEIYVAVSLNTPHNDFENH